MVATPEFVSVAVGVVVQVDDELVEQNIGYLPWVLGENLAGQIDAFVSETGLGYYPALDYFRLKPDVVDPALIALTDQVAAFCGEYSRRELRRRLSAEFAAVKLQRLQCMAYTMPRVRPSRGNAPGDLAGHYSPNTMKLDLVLQAALNGDVAASESRAVQTLISLARELFEQFEVLNSRCLELP